MTTQTTVTVKFFERGAGSRKTIVEAPWAEALATIDGLAQATGNATYRGVQFGRDLQSKLVIYLKVDAFSPQWEAIRATGSGPYTFDAAYLDSILAAAAKIEAVIAKAVPAGPDYPCAEAKSGCRARVKVQGAYCRSCQHDA